MELIKCYPFNLALDIFKNEEHALSIFVKGIEYALSTLSEREQKILMLRYKDNMIYKDISEIDGVSISRVRVIVLRCLHKLRHPSIAKHIVAYSFSDIENTVSEKNKLIERNKQLEKAILMYSTKGKTTEEIEQLANSIDIMQIKLEQLELTSRSYNSLKRYGINSLGDLAIISLDDLSKIRNVGKGSLIEVTNELKQYGIILK